MRESKLKTKVIKWTASAMLIVAVAALLGAPYGATTDAVAQQRRGEPEAQPRRPDPAQRAGQSSPKGPGMEPFTPTKLQWLTLELNATLSAQEFQQSWFLRFDSQAPDRVVMEITYNSARANQELMKRVAAVSKGAAEGIIKNYGFDSWARIEERYTDLAAQQPGAPAKPAQSNPAQPKPAQRQSAQPGSSQPAGGRNP